MILVTGGTGLVGAHLLWQLLQEHDSITATHRKGSNLKRVEKIFNYYAANGSTLFQKIKWIEADLCDIPKLEQAFEQIDYVYHAAALISFDPKHYNNLVKTNAEGTANVVNLCIEKRVKKLCYVSTIGTIGKSVNATVATEENEWNDQHINVYARSKYRAEMEVWRGSQEGLAVVMVNPGIIIGPGFWEAGTGALFTTAHKGYRWYPPGGTGFVTVHDVVRMMIDLMVSPIKNERFIAVAKNLSFKEILTQLTAAMGKPQPKKQLKYWQLEIGRLADFLWCTLSGNSRKITKNSIHSMKHRDAYSSAKIEQSINFKFEPLAETIAFSCAQFVAENP